MLVEDESCLPNPKPNGIGYHTSSNFSFPEFDKKEVWGALSPTRVPELF